MVFGISVLSRIRRGNENVCYVPSRAKHSDPSYGSYKLIQPKDEQPICQAPVNMPDYIRPSDEKQPYHSFEYITRKTCEKVLSIPMDYAKIDSPPKNLAAYEERLEPTEKPPEEIPEEDDKNSEEAELVKTEEACSSPMVRAQSVVVEEDEESSEEEVEMPVELPEVTQWWRSVPALEAFAKSRASFLKTLSEENDLRGLTSLVRDQRSPVEFIRDFFGAVPPGATEAKQRPQSDAGGAPEDAADTTPEQTDTEQLKNAVVLGSERLVADLQAAAALVSAATASNEQLGRDVLQRLSEPLAAKFTSLHTEVFNISSLMTALSARLARTYDESERTDDKQLLAELQTKQQKLKEQLVEARSLKDNIDCRAALLSARAAAALDPATYQQYRLYMAVKPRLVIRSRHLQYRIEYEQERLESLQQTLVAPREVLGKASPQEVIGKASPQEVLGKASPQLLSSQEVLEKPEAV